MSLGLTLWGRASSANVQKTLWAFEELGVPYDIASWAGHMVGWTRQNFVP